METSSSEFKELKSLFRDFDGSEMEVTNNLFAERRACYLNEFSLYLASYRRIPNLISEEDIDGKKANAWFKETFASSIQNVHYSERYFKSNRTRELDDVFYFLDEDLMVNFDINNSEVRCLFRDTSRERVEELLQGILKFKSKKRSKVERRLHILTSGRHGLDTTAIEIKKPKLSLAEHYNEDFMEVHQTIMKRLTKQHDKGIVLLHGKPGTGKTSYIRYLVSVLKKKVIFLPPNMASALTTPALMATLLENTNVVLVIEDAETIVVDRENDQNSAVSTLLNISDGLLSDCLGIQIICSFNVDLSKVDSALLRKGRLIAKYDFKELEAEKAQSLSRKLGFTAPIHQPMTLAAIYNQEEKDVLTVPKKAIGFQYSNT